MNLQKKFTEFPLFMFFYNVEVFDWDQNRHQKCQYNCLSKKQYHFRAPNKKQDFFCEKNQ